MAQSAITYRGYGNGVDAITRRGFAAYTGLPQPPAAGWQYATCTTAPYGGSGDSMETGSSPAVAVGDVFVTKLVTSPSSFAISINGDGTVNITSGGNTSRQSFQYEIYRVLSNAIDGPATIWINEVGPAWAGGLFINNLPINTVFNPLSLVGNPYATSPEGDSLTFALASGALPPGMALSSSGILSGTPTVDGTYSFVFAASDSTGIPAGTTNSPSSGIIVYTPVVPPPPPPPPSATGIVAPPADTAGAKIDAQIAVLQALVTANTNPAIEYQLQQTLNQWQVEAVTHYMVTGWANAAAILALWQPPSWDAYGQKIVARVAFLQNLVNNPPVMPAGNANGYGDSGWTTIASAYAQALYAEQMKLVMHIMDLPGGTSAATILAGMDGAQTAPGGIPYAYVFSSVGFTDADQDD